ncbi:hypothetical protein ABPG77_008739 [Micractinium sp. CCAP 211/92]
MAPPSASSRKRGAADNVVDVEIFNGTPSVQRRIRRRRAVERTQAQADKKAAEDKAEMVVRMCTRLHRSGHTNLARVLQAALSEEPDIKAEGVSTRVEVLDSQ